MKQFISINKKRLDLLLIPLCLFFYFKVYWFICSFVTESLLDIPIVLSHLRFFGASFLFSAAPCSHLLRSLICKIFDKLKGCFSFHQHLHQHAPQSQHQGVPHHRVIWANGRSSMRFALLNTAMLPEPPILVGEYVGGNRTLRGRSPSGGPQKRPSW